MPLLERSWQRTWQALGTQAPHGLREQLMVRYAEPQRHYHTLQHLSECLQLLEPVLQQAQHPGELELALWFHDAIYEPHRHDNEASSAQWAKVVMQGAGLGVTPQDRVVALIMATCHSALPQTPDEQLLVDVDLSILGAAPERFARYETQVRAEYAWVPAWLYRRKRRAILRAFLDRPTIYTTAHFEQTHEAQARLNLKGAGKS